MIDPTAVSPHKSKPESQPVASGVRMPAVRWFSPVQLFRTSREASAGTEFARFADKRETQSGVPLEFYDLTDGVADAYTIDYVADTGDGFNATFAVAAQVNGLFSAPEPADLLVLGGDEVYPVASVRNYEDRLVAPFDAARPADGYGQAQLIDDAFVVALPGNHDWYDALVAFRRNFCESWIGRPAASGLVPTKPGAWRDVILSRQAIQSRSYFALKLPHGWWLWGIDSQLDSHIDAVQLDYFSRARELISETDRVILCTARPSWLDHATADDRYWTSNREVLVWFLDRMFGNGENPGKPDRRHQVPIMLSGDKHHYAHYQRKSESPESPEHLVTCGGGGAYLSPTHPLEESLPVDWQLTAGTPTDYVLKKAFPTASDSRELRKKWPQIPFRNGGWWPTLVGGVQVVLAILLTLAITKHNATAWVFSGLITLVVLGALTAFNRGFTSPWLPTYKRFVPGMIHGFAYVGAAVGCAFIVRSVLTPWSWGRGLLAVIAYLFFGALAVWGFALYLRIADHFGFHEDQLFSALRIEDRKSYLRLTISPPTHPATTGDLRIDAIGIPEVHRQNPAEPLQGSPTEPIETFHWPTKP